MAEDFPHYRQEDSDDDSPADRSSEHSEPAPVPEQHAPAQQEGTIFSRDEVAPHLSRPLFEFIRKQEQPGARAETSVPPKAELPSVSLPSDPEVQTYQPPEGAEVAQAIRQTNAEYGHAEDDDDDAEATDDHRAVSPSAPAPVPAAPRASERSLNEQFEEIIRAEMGTDFAELTSGDKLGEAAKTAETDEVPEEPASGAPEVFAMPDTPVEEVPIPDGVTEEGAFYYNEDVPEDTAEDPLAVAVPNGSSRGGSSGGPTPVPPRPRSTRPYSAPVASTPSPAAGGGGTGTGGGPGGPTGGGPTSPSMSGGMPMGGFNAAPSLAPNAANFAVNPNFAAPAVERRENHNGRWFVAGFVTGWVIKQHLANRKLARVQNEHRQEVAGQNERIDSLQVRQQNMQREIRTGEGQLQEARANQLKAADERAREQARAEQAARIAGGGAPAAERPAPGAPSVEMPLQAAASTVEQSQPQSPAEQAAAASPAAEQSVVAGPRSAAEMPLSQTGGGVEAAFAAAGGALGFAETPFDRAFSNETPAAAAAEEAAERAVRTPHEAAQDAVAQAYELQNGEHVIHAAGGGHNIVVDKHGNEVEGAMQYADEFKFQQRQEQARAGAFDDDESEDENALPEAALDPQQLQERAQLAQQQRRRSGAGVNYGANIVTGLASGLPNAAHEIGNGMSDARKRLTANIPSKNQNPVVATLASPWLWASVFVLLAAFFVAAFI
jgi:hypothetical protein